MQFFPRITSMLSHTSSCTMVFCKFSPPIQSLWLGTFHLISLFTDCQIVIRFYTLTWKYIWKPFFPLLRQWHSLLPQDKIIKSQIKLKATLCITSTLCILLHQKVHKIWFACLQILTKKVFHENLIKCNVMRFCFYGLTFSCILSIFMQKVTHLSFCWRTRAYS